MANRKTNFGARRTGTRSGTDYTREQVKRDGPARAFTEHKRPIQASTPRAKVGNP